MVARVSSNNYFLADESIQIIQTPARPIPLAAPTMRQVIAQAIDNLTGPVTESVYFYHNRAPAPVAVPRSVTAYRTPYDATGVQVVADSGAPRLVVPTVYEGVLTLFFDHRLVTVIAPPVREGQLARIHEQVEAGPRGLIPLTMYRYSYSDYIDGRRTA